MPFAIDFHDATELAIRRRMIAVPHVAIWQGRAKGDVAVFVHCAFKFLFAERAFDVRIEMGKGLGIIPNMGTGAGTTAIFYKATFPGPRIAVLLA